MNTKVDYFEFYQKALLELQGNELKVYICLLFLHKNKNHTYSFPSQELIAAETNLSERTVTTVVKSLQKKGYVKIRKQKCSGENVFHKNIYDLLLIPTVEHKVAPKEVATGLDDLDCADEEETTDKKKAKSLIEGKLNLKLTKWQSYVSREMDTYYLLQAIGTYIKKKGRTFSFLIQLYTDLLCKNNIFTEQLAKFFKVDWTGNKADHEQRIAEIESRDEYDDILYSIYTPEEVAALKADTMEESFEDVVSKEVNDPAFEDVCSKLGIAF